MAELTRKNWTQLLLIILILAVVTAFLSPAVFKILWALGTNIKVVLYVVGGIVLLKLLSLLGFKK